MNYIVFSLLYCLSIMIAVILGATVGIVPTDSVWHQNISLLNLADLTLRLSITLLPTCILIVLNTIRFDVLLVDRQFSLRHTLGYVVLGVVATIPLLFTGVSVYIFMGFIIGWPEIVVVQAFIGSSVLLVYALAIATITATNSGQVLLRTLRNPSAWIAALILGAILMFTTVSLLNPLSKGYFRFFPSGEQFLLQLPDLVFRCLANGLVLPALPLVLIQLGLDSR